MVGAPVIALAYSGVRLLAELVGYGVEMK